MLTMKIVATKLDASSLAAPSNTWIPCSAQLSYIQHYTKQLLSPSHFMWPRFRPKKNLSYLLFLNITFHYYTNYICILYSFLLNKHYYTHYFLPLFIKILISPTTLLTFQLNLLSFTTFILISVKVKQGHLIWDGGSIFPRHPHILPSSWLPLR